MVRCLPNKEGPGAQGPGAHMGPGPYGPWPIWALAHMAAIIKGVAIMDYGGVD